VTAFPVPVDLGGQIAFLGYHLSGTSSAVCSTAVRPGSEIVLTTAWQVTARSEHPRPQTLSVFAHLVGPTGAVSVGDGLGFPAIQWLPGDVFVQRNWLPIPPEVSPGQYWMQVGLYSLATEERLPVLEGGQPAGDRILLATVEVKR